MPSVTSSKQLLWEAWGCLALGGAGKCSHLIGEGRRGVGEGGEAGECGPGRHQAGALQNVSTTGSGSQHTCGLADRPPRLPAAARGAGVCGAGAWILLGSGSTRPHPGAGSHQPHPVPSLGPLCTSARPGLGRAGAWGVQRGHTWGRPWGGVGQCPLPPGSGSPGSPAHSPSPPPPWEEARLPQNADLDEMVFYGDLLKRGEIPVKDLQLSKHRVCPAAARTQSPESASPERVPPPRLRTPASPASVCPHLQRGHQRA